jgi:hypothetical protein
MTEKSENAVLYAAAVYTDVEGALSDLGAFQQLHKDEMLGKYDAAVIDKQEGKPHIVKRRQSGHSGHPGVAGSGNAAPQGAPRRGAGPKSRGGGAGRCRRSDAREGVRQGCHPSSQDRQAGSERRDRRAGKGTDRSLQVLAHAKRRAARDGVARATRGCRVRSRGRRRRPSCRRRLQPGSSRLGGRTTNHAG